MIRTSTRARRWVTLIDRGPVIAAVLGILATALALVATLLLAGLGLYAAGVPRHSPGWDTAMTLAVVVAGAAVGWALALVLPVISAAYDRRKMNPS